MILRPYQERAIGDLRAAYQSGKRAPCLVLPTGAGKAVIAAAIIRMAQAKGTRSLFLAPRIELLRQEVDKLIKAEIPAKDIRVIQADRDEGSIDAPVVVASIPTLVTPRWQDKLPDAGLVVIDEAHHLKAKSQEALVRRYSSSKLLAMTATPQRGDGRALGDVLDSLVVGATVNELTQLGHLVPCKVYAPRDIMNPRELAQEPIDAYVQHALAHKRPTIVFCATVEHGRVTTERFVSRGIRAAFVHADSKDRDATLQAFDRGDLDVIVNVNILVEGWDAPRAQVAIFARRFTYVGGHLQAIGRVLRPVDGKLEAIVVDLCGSALVHGTPDIEREYSLDGKGISSAERLKIRQCQQCGGVFTERAACPYCAFACPPMKRKEPRAIGSDLSELPANSRPTQKWWVPMDAKWPSVCPCCSRPIAKGAKIVWAKGEKPRHIECAREIARKAKAA